MLSKYHNTEMSFNMSHFTSVTSEDSEQIDLMIIQGFLRTWVDRFLNWTHSLVCTSQLPHSANLFCSFVFKQQIQSEKFERNTAGQLIRSVLHLSLLAKTLEKSWKQSRFKHFRSLREFQLIKNVCGQNNIHLYMSHLLSDVLMCSQVFSRRSQMCSRYAQMFTMFWNIHRCSQIFTDVLRCSLDVL